MTSRPVTRVVIRAPNWLGDAVMALPAMAAVRTAFSGAHLAIAAVPSVATLFREETGVRPEAVIELPAASRSAIARLTGEGFDLGILFPNSFRSAWQLRRAMIPERWGYAKAGRGWLLTRRSKRARSRHQADYYRDLVRGVGLECAAETEPRVGPRAASLERARAMLAEHRVDLTRPVVGFAPGAAYGQAKQWPPDRMAEVAASVAAAHDASIVIVGAAHDRDAARGIESWLRLHAPEALERVVNLTGRTSLGALVGLMSLMSAFVSNDSGAMHLAAATGCPVVAVFGPTDERATRPVGNHTVITSSVFCRPCMLRDCPIDHRCMKRIQPATVTEAVTAALLRGRRLLA